VLRLALSPRCGLPALSAGAQAGAQDTAQSGREALIPLPFPAAREWDTVFAVLSPLRERRPTLSFSSTTEKGPLLIPSPHRGRGTG